MKHQPVHSKIVQFSAWGHVPFIDTTLREGEQFAQARFTLAQKKKLAEGLDEMGIPIIELTSPASNLQARRDMKALAGMRLQARLAAHCRCRLEEVKLAVDCGVRVIHVFFGVSPWLQQHGHGRKIGQIIDAAVKVIELLRQGGCEVRFSCEDAFRSQWADIQAVALAADQLAVHRISLADTVGVATPMEVSRMVRRLRKIVRADIGFHGHNDCGCAVANSWAALEAGASWVDVSLLGIGERNGIASLGGMVARLLISKPELLCQLKKDRVAPLEWLAAEFLRIETPFNSCVSSPYAFTHKAGVHTRAVINRSGCYEGIDPSLMGLKRKMLVMHPLTGKGVVEKAFKEKGVALRAEQLHWLTQVIKMRSSTENLGEEDLDLVLTESPSRG